jgi:threonine dehydrogenase-like Zn-dependent dehydrogenase
VKAVVVEKPGAITIRDIPAPKPGDYQVLCRLLYGATCSGTDLHLIDGTFPWPVNYPILLGHESIGRVVEVGPKVRNFKVGDLVTRVGTPAPAGSGLGVFGGGFAELGIAGDYEAMKADGLPFDQWQGYRVNQRLPRGTDAAEATMVMTWRETFSDIVRMGFKKGGSLLVIGSGANGFCFASHARNLGASFVAMVGSPARGDTAGALGVDAYFDYHAVDLAKAVGAARQGGFDFAIDAIGKKGMIDLAISAVRPNGTAAVYGLDNFASLTIDLSKVFKPFKYTFSNYEESEAHKRVVAFMRAGKLQAGHFVDLRNPFSLETIREAYEYARSRKALKALVKIA